MAIAALPELSVRLPPRLYPVVVALSVGCSDHCAMYTVDQIGTVRRG
jgi:hypothetical protein